MSPYRLCTTSYTLTLLSISLSFGFGYGKIRQHLLCVARQVQPQFSQKQRKQKTKSGLPYLGHKTNQQLNHISTMLQHTSLQFAFGKHLTFSCVCVAKSSKWQSLASMFLFCTYNSKESYMYQKEMIYDNTCDIYKHEKKNISTCMTNNKYIHEQQTMTTCKSKQHDIIA